MELGSHVDLPVVGPLEDPEEIRWTSLLNECPRRLSVLAIGEDDGKPRAVGPTIKLTMMFGKQKTRGDAESQV